MWSSFLLLLVLLTGCVNPVIGYSDGKVSIACGDMVPQHGYDPSPEPPPYTITVDKSTFSPGDNITGRLLNFSFTGCYSDPSPPLISFFPYSSSTVSLQVAPSHPMFFKGFLIEARDAGKLDFPAVGSFFLTDPHQSQLLQCGHTQVYSYISVF